LELQKGLTISYNILCLSQNSATQSRGILTWKNHFSTKVVSFLDLYIGWLLSWSRTKNMAEESMCGVLGARWSKWPQLLIHGIQFDRDQLIFLNITYFLFLFKKSLVDIFYFLSSTRENIKKFSELAQVLLNESPIPIPETLSSECKDFI